MESFWHPSTLTSLLSNDRFSLVIDLLSVWSVRFLVITDPLPRWLPQISFNKLSLDPYSASPIPSRTTLYLPWVWMDLWLNGPALEISFGGEIRLEFGDWFSFWMNCRYDWLFCQYVWVRFDVGREEREKKNLWVSLTPLKHRCIKVSVDVTSRLPIWSTENRKQ